MNLVTLVIIGLTTFLLSALGILTIVLVQRDPWRAHFHSKTKMVLDYLMVTYLILTFIGFASIMIGLGRM